MATTNGSTSASTEQTPQEEYSFGNPPPMGNAFIGDMFGIPQPPQRKLPMRKFRGSTLLQPFDMRERMKAKEALLGFGLGLPSPEVARLLAGLGFDFIFLDWEHLPMGIKEISELIRWINHAGEGTCAVVVRLPSHDHTWLAWALDAGASAVILPHTETVEQAKAAVDAARFYTQGGHRSYPPASMHIGVNDGDVGGALPWDIYNRAAVICQLESKLAAENADKIAQVPGVDGLMIGHADLRADLGLMMANDGPEPEYQECVKKILNAAHTHGDLPVLTFAPTPDAVETRRKQGYRMFMTGMDAFAIAMVGRNQLKAALEACERAEANGE